MHHLFGDGQFFKYRFRNRPIHRINPLFHVAMKSRVWPINAAIHIAMLNGIPMDIIDMTFEIDVIAN